MGHRITLSLFILALLLLSPADASESPRLPHPDSLVYKPLRFDPPQARRHAFDNGIILYTLEDRELPVVTVSAVFRSGSVHDAAGKAGLAELTHRAMRTGGTTSLTGDAFEDLLAYHGMKLDLSAEMDRGTAHLSVLRQDLDRGFDLFAQMLRAPRFADDKLQIAKDLTIEGLRGIADDPPKLAFRQFRKLLYRNNPRGNLYTAQSIRNIERPDLIAFHQRHFYPHNTLLAVTGDITREEAIRLVQRYFGDWQAAGQPEAPPPPVHQQGAIHFLHKEIPQSVIVCGHLAPSKREQDYYAFTVLDFLLGSGGFRSRIFQEIRSGRGLAYSTGSFYQPRKDYGVFGAYVMTRASATATALSLLRQIFRDMTETGATREELSWAKKSLINSFIFSFQSPDQIASQQMSLEFDQLPADFLEKYPGNVDRVTAEDLQRTAGRFLSPERTVTLVLGNENAFEQPLSTLGAVHPVEGDL